MARDSEFYFSPRKLLELKKALVQAYKEQWHDQNRVFPKGTALYDRISAMLSASGETVNSRAVAEFWNAVNEANDHEYEPYSFDDRKNISINHLKRMANFLNWDFQSLRHTEEAQAAPGLPSVQEVAKTYFRNLISFRESQELELQSEELLCLTSNLVWAAEEIDKIVADLLLKPYKRYRYILTEFTLDGKSNKTDILTKVAEKELSERLEIRVLSKSERFRGMHDCVVLPILNDFTVYRNTLHEGSRQSVLVTSTIRLEQGKHYDKDAAFDILITDRQSVNNFVQWFQTMWKEIGDNERL